MIIRINFKTDGNDPKQVTVGPSNSTETIIELEGEVDEVMPFFDKLRADGITHTG